MMENEKLLVPVVLSIIKTYEQQADSITKQLKNLEYDLKLNAVTSKNSRDKLVKKVNTLRFDLTEKNVIVKGLSEIYHRRVVKSDNFNNIDGYIAHVVSQ